MIASFGGQRAAAFLMALAFWLSANRYIGIDHDARLYVLMASHWLSPDSYARDPWFAFGSQDDWSLFSPYLGIILKLLGVSHGAMLATLVQAVLFCVAALYLGGAMFRGRAGMLAGFLVASIPILYSPRGMLFVTEGFVTARGLAIPLSLIGLGLAFRNRGVPSLATTAAALLFHPIMAFAPAAVSVMLLAGKRRAKWLFILAALGIVVVFCSALVGRLSLVDDSWYYYASPAVLVFIDQWLIRDLPDLLFWAVPLVTAALYANPARRRVYELVMVVAVIAVAVSYVAAFYPVTIVLQAQFWRTLWLAKLVALVAAVDIGILLLVQRNRPYWRLLSAVMLALVLISLTHPLFAIVLLVASKLLSVTRLDWRRSPLCQHQHLIAYALPVLVLLLLPHLYFGLHSVGAALPPSRALPDWVLGVLGTGGFGIAAFLFWFALCKLPLRYSIIFVGLSLAVAVSGWDARGDERVALERGYRLPGDTSRVPNLIPPGSVVYWHQGSERVWFTLGTAGYASTTHATGLIFSRTRTLLLADRLQRLVVASSNLDRDIEEIDLSVAFARISARLPDLRLNVLAAYEDEMGRGLSNIGVRILCRDRELDFVIDLNHWKDLMPEMLPDLYDDGSGREYYVYQCKKLNQQPPLGDIYSALDRSGG
ncbi:MAG: hypothetical protein HYU78_15205 [Rhodocyclales bacterium]|nr:hypothetical protein [Rhodocyclales bacterium]